MIDSKEAKKQYLIRLNNYYQEVCRRIDNYLINNYSQINSDGFILMDERAIGKETWSLIKFQYRKEIIEKIIEDYGKNWKVTIYITRENKRDKDHPRTFKFELKNKKVKKHLNSMTSPKKRLDLMEIKE